MPIAYEPQPPPRNVGNLRLFWIIWCLLWAAFWFISGFFTLIGFLGAPIALLFLLLPIGKSPRPKAYFVPPQSQLGPSQTNGAADPAYQQWLKEQGRAN
jgi:hypothetical protein